MLAFLKRTFRVGEWLRRGLGVAVLAGVVLIAAGLDAQLLSRISLASTASIEETLLNGLVYTGPPHQDCRDIDNAASPSSSAYGRHSWVLPPAERNNSLPLIDVVFKEPSLLPAGSTSARKSPPGQRLICRWKARCLVFPALPNG